jgi:hypothetical protein
MTLSILKLIPRTYLFPPSRRPMPVSHATLVLTFHRQMVPFVDVDERIWLLGVKATHFSPPRKDLQAVPWGRFQSFTVPSADVLAIKRPSGEKATLLTESVWSWRTPHTAPVLTLHNRTVLSHDADARRLSSGEKATLCTRPEWPHNAP